MRFEECARVSRTSSSIASTGVWSDQKRRYAMRIHMLERDARRNGMLIEERRAVLAKLVEGLLPVFPGQDRPGRSDDAAPLSPSLSAGLRRVTVTTSRLRPARRPAASLLSQSEFELVDTLNP